MDMLKLSGANGSVVYINLDSITCIEPVNQQYKDFLRDKYMNRMYPNDLSSANTCLIVGNGSVYVTETVEEITQGLKNGFNEL